MLNRPFVISALAGLLLSGSSAMAETKYAFTPYAGDDGKAVVCPESGEPKIKIPAAADPAISPDGTQLVFTQFLNSGRRLAVADLKGGRPRTIPMDAKEVYGGLWSPDGQWLAFHIYTDQWRVGVVKPDGSGFKVLGQDLPPNESYYLSGWNLKTGEPLAHDLKNLVQLKMDGSSAWNRPFQQLFGVEYVDSGCCFWVAPDGRTLVGNVEVTSDEIANIHGPSNYLMSTDLQSGKPERISPVGMHAGSPFMAYDGSAILFEGFVSADLKPGKGDEMDMTMRIYRLTLPERSLNPLFQNGWQPSQSLPQPK